MDLTENAVERSIIAIDRHVKFHRITEQKRDLVHPPSVEHDVPIMRQAVTFFFAEKPICALACMEQVALVEVEMTNLVHAAVFFFEIAIEDRLVDRTVRECALSVFPLNSDLLFGLKLFLLFFEKVNLFLDFVKAGEVFGEALHSVEEDSLGRELLVVFDQ